MLKQMITAWERKPLFFYLLLIPLSWLFLLLTALRRLAYQFGLLYSAQLPVPIIIIGNINMGGSGKTPVVIWLVKQLKKYGYIPGVISRGYGANNVQPVPVGQMSLAAEVGDEPLLIARQADCPVWVAKNRVKAARALLAAHPTCNVIVSDDGLQHYRLRRDVEIAVVDSESLQAKYCLPAGPLREPQHRLQTVDAIVCHTQQQIANSFSMQLIGQTFYNLANPNEVVSADYFKGKLVKAVAGIGKPERFFNGLREMGVVTEGIDFPDHHAFTAQDLESICCEALLMTEKDAVKCQPFAKAHYWVLPVQAEIEAGLLPLLLSKLKAIQH